MATVIKKTINPQGPHCDFVQKQTEKSMCFWGLNRDFTRNMRGTAEKVGHHLSTNCRPE
nr:MAG TPA: hypothetical protein [Caudoviricetes sp.]